MLVMGLFISLLIAVIPISLWWVYGKEHNPAKGATTPTPHVNARWPAQLGSPYNR